MKKLFTLMLFAVAFHFHPAAQAQKLLESMESASFKKILKQAQKVNTLQNARSAANQTIRVAQKATQYDWDAATSAWVPQLLYTYTYNNNGLWQSIVEQTLPGEVNETKTTDIVYDAQGRETQSIQQQWDGSAWVNSVRSRTEYDAQTGDIKLDVEDEWQGAQGWSLNSGFKYTYTYGAVGRIDQTITQTYESASGWVNSEKQVYTYAGTGTQPTGYSFFEWMDDQWIELERVSEITYENGLEKSFIMESYDDETETWEKSRSTFAYSSNATNHTNTVVQTIELYDEGTWETSARMTITILENANIYAGEASLAEYKVEAYGGTSWFMVFGYKNNFTRDTNGDITEMVLQTADLLSGGIYTNVSKTVFSEFTTLTVTSSPSDVLTLATEVYPNPVQRSLHISVDATKVRNATLGIYSITGQQVHGQRLLNATTTIDLAKLPSGVYMVRLVDEKNAAVTRRIVKQ